MTLINQITWTPAELSQPLLGFTKVLFLADEQDDTKFSTYQQQLEDRGYIAARVNNVSELGPFIAPDMIIVHLPIIARSKDELYDTATTSCTSLINAAQTLQSYTEKFENTSYKLFSLIPGDTDDLGYASLHGLARVLKFEIPAIFGGLFQEDEGVFPIDAMQSAQGFDFVKLSQGTPQTAVLRSLPGKPSRFEVDSNGSYLVTGGTRGMGLEIATWMAERGAGNIILVSRSGRLEPDHPIYTLNAKVHILAVDVSKPDAATRLSQAIARLQIPPIRGVVHAAGVAEYNTLARCPPEDVAAVLAPKIVGGLALDKLFPPNTLDFFILTSSFGQLVGFEGQLSYAPANSFLDGLAAHRRHQGDNSTSIQWSCWHGVGLMAQNPSATRMITKGMNARGFGGISKEEAFESLDVISGLGVDQVAVVRALELRSGEPLRHPILKEIAPRRQEAAQDYPEHAIAIVGLACRTAAGDTADDLWQTISTGKTWEQEAGDRFPDLDGKTKLWGNFMKDIKSFDHQFFKKTRREAAALDPHQRLLLETVYHALESAGEFGGGKPQRSETHDGDQTTGCFIGMNAPDYPLNLACHPASPYTGFGMLRSFVAGRLSHHFGWTGPAHTIDTACSSAMVAIHQACRAIQAGECTRAIAGGVNLMTNTALFHALGTGGFLNPDGACKTFDAQASGYCRGDAVGAIILKPLELAMKDGDDIKGVLLSTGNNQNINNTSITNPVTESQAALYRQVISRAGIDPKDISYVEAHGTGTRAGDPLEVKSIRNVVGGKSRDNVLHIGAIKPNVGHSEGASGIISLIKVLLMMKHGKITPQAHFKTLNPTIGALEPDKMAISTTLQPWDADNRLALVNSYGASGNNACAVVGAPPTPQSAGPNTMNISWPIIITAASKLSLVNFANKLSGQIETTADVSFALATKQNRRLQNVFITTASNLKCLADVEQQITTAARPKPVVLLFSGQNGNTIPSAKPLYEASALFRTYLHRCDDVIRSMKFPSILPAVLEGIQGDGDLVPRHAAMFAIQYASGMAWLGSGVVPQAICGLSFGEWAALTVSGALTLEAGVRLITGRATIIQNRWGPDPGSMVAIETNTTPEQFVESFLSEFPSARIDVACHNGPNNYVVAGSTADIDSLAEYLSQQKSLRPNLRFKVLRGMHAYHSHMADPIVEESAKLSASIPFREPTFPFESCHSDTWTGPGENVVARNTRGPVYFGQTITRIVDRLGSCVFLEAGFGGPIVAMAKSAIPNHSQHAFVAVNGKDPVQSLADATVNLWKNGLLDVQFWPFHKTQRGSYGTVSLPQYQFEKHSHWLEYTGFASKETKVVTPTPSASCLKCTTADIPYITMEKLPIDTGRYTFSINPQSNRYKDLVAGHAVVGSPICPAAMYLELASHAVALLPDVQRMYSIPEIGVDGLEIKAPLGLDIQRNIQLLLTKEAEASWKFNLSSVKNEKTLLHAVGTVSLQMDRKADPGDEAKWARILSLREDADAEALRGTMVYKVFSSMAHYSPAYRGLRHLVGKGTESAGDILMPEAALDLVTRSPNENIADPLVMDTFLQVPGAFVHSLRPDGAENGAMSFICTGMQSVRPLSGLRGSGKYRAYAKIVREDNKEAALDVLAFDQETRKVIWSCKGLTFSRIPRASLARALAAANPDLDLKTAAPPTAAPLTAAPLTAAPLTAAALMAAPLTAAPSKMVKAPATVQISKPTVNVLAGVRQILSKSLDIPPETITEPALLEDLGVDSLVSSELISRLSKELAVEISVGEFAALSDVASLCDLISSRTKATPVTVSAPSRSVQKPGNSFEDLQEVLSKSLDIPIDLITRNSSLEDLGADSLVASEILAGIYAKFGSNISIREFAEIEDVKTLYNTIISSEDSASESESISQESVSRNSGSTFVDLSERQNTIKRILSDSLHVPVMDIHLHSKLEDLGVDSLVSVEILNSLNQALHVEITAEDFASLDDVESLCALIGGGTFDAVTDSSRSTSALTADEEVERSLVRKMSIHVPKTSIQQAFMSVRRNFDTHAQSTKLTGYWDKVYPQQLVAVTAFIVEAFEKLECPIQNFAEGEILPSLPTTLDKYDREVPRLWDILEEAGVVERKGGVYVRGPAALPSKPAQELSSRLISDFPAFSSTHTLPDILGPHLAESLVGKADPVSLLFGSDRGRTNLADFYANGPDLRACTNVLCDFFSAAIHAQAEDGEPFRVLEIGAGTGGTTKHLLPLLQATGLPFQYTFTELSGSLLARAKNTTFKGVVGMDFRKLDIEKEPPAELLGKYHIVVSSNCIHATRNLDRCMTNIRKVVRPNDGCVALVELTQKLAWYDLVWGLLDGWWLFDDGRKYALQSPWAWEQVMLRAGFASVDWSESSSRESRGVRVICGMSGQAEQPLKANSILLHRGAPEKNVFLFPDGFGHGAVFRSLQPCFSRDYSVYALNSPFLRREVDPNDLFTIEELAGVYVAEIKRRQPKGPYHLGGYSFGGLVAYEAARQLLEDENEVEKLILIDTACPTSMVSMPTSLVNFLDSISQTSKDQPINSDHFSLSRKQLAIYKASKLPGRKLPKVVLFSAGQGVDKQSVVSRPHFRPDEKILAEWFLDDRKEGPLGWDELLEDVTVIRAEGNHFSMMSSPQVDGWGLKLAKFLAE